MYKILPSGAQIGDCSAHRCTHPGTTTTVACARKTWTLCPPSFSSLVYLRMLALSLNTKHAVR